LQSWKCQHQRTACGQACQLRCGAQVTGDEASEQVLDEVFSRFCIGK